MAVMSNTILPACCNITSDKSVKLYCHLGCCDSKEWWYKEVHESTCKRLQSFSDKLLTKVHKESK